MHRLPFACLLVAAACGGSASEPDEARSNLERKKAPSSADVPELVAGNNAFAAALYDQVQGGVDGNLFMSPYSVSTALGMTYAGAAGDTATQMADAMSYTLAPAKLFEAFNSLDLTLESRAENSDSKVIPFQLHVASSLWYQKGATVLAPFLDALAVNFGAGLFLTEFHENPDGAREEINAWVSDRTNQKIPEVLAPGSVDPATRFAIANAIYFSAAWQTPFDASNTADGAFHAKAGDVTAHLMHASVESQYGEGEGWRAVELPYDGNQLSMVVVVPDDLAAFEGGLERSTFDDIASALTPHLVTLTLPKFEFRTPLELAKPLQRLGMADAFDDETADFSPIDGDRDLFLYAVVHQAFIHLDEKGTEAAAATVVLGGDASLPELATLAADKPFFFFIRDIPTGAVLFVGRVADPTK